jgi:hypothetical protein
MSAHKKNPFLVGFAVVMVLGVGALGYLTYAAADENSKAREEYDEAAAELKRLQGLRPFPNEEHLKKFQEQRAAVEAKVNDLQKALAAIKIKIEDISPTGFQDKLRDAVARVTSKAAESNVALPQDFYLGMKDYQGNPPKGPAAPPLYRELRAIEAAMNIILDVKNVQIRELKREELLEERGPAPVISTPQNKNRKVEDDTKKLVHKDTFTLKFASTQENFQRILNGLATHKEQFFVPRYIIVKNEAPDPPPKVEVAAAAPVAPAEPLPAASAAPGAANPPAAPGAVPADPAAPAAPAQPEAPKLEYKFGKELVEVTMDIDIVDVKEPEAKAEPKK